MSDMAKQARAAMKAKASRLTTADPHQKVDSSTWTPPEPLDTEVKTGLRPISRRAFKSGGKVGGAKPKMNLGKSTRTGNKPITPDNFANKDVKAANQDRMGLKHVGGLKTGGRAKREEGGVAVKKIPIGVSGLNPEDKAKWDKQLQAGYTIREKIPKFTPTYEEPQELTGNLSFKKGGKAKRKGREEGGQVDEIAEVIKRSNTERSPSASAAGMANMPLPVPRPKNLGKPERFKSKYDLTTQSEKHGGKVKKAVGGPLAGAQAMMKKAQQTAGVPASTLDSVPATSRLSKAAGLKKGGTAKHDDVKADMALIKKMVKPAAMRKGRDDGGRADIFMAPNKNTRRQDQVNEFLRNDLTDADFNASKMGLMERIGKGAKYAGKALIEPLARVGAEVMDDYGLKKGGKVKRAARKEGGGVFSGPGYPGKVPGVTGGRIARATGGKTRGKGKTNINIIVAAGKPAGGQDMMNPMGGPTRPPGMDGGLGGVAPVPVPPAGGAPGAMPMPVPMPMPMPQAGPPPAPRKSGGRLTAKASSYKDMTAGSGGGEGRLQKTDIAAKHKDAPAFKKGGKVYRSYKDMDAGSGSGLGRLEKTEIQSHKR